MLWSEKNNSYKDANKASPQPKKNFTVNTRLF